MHLLPNPAPPTIMHIDLNSCFATIEQQANHLLRGKPIAVAAYNSPNGCILAPSIEAKRYGIKTSMRVKEGQLLYPQLVILTPDPPKYRDVHIKFKHIFQTYSSKVIPKSIDEAIIDFNNVSFLKIQNGSPTNSLTQIALEIKHRLRTEIGDWISCSIGLGPNRFLAKTAASLQKPDGLETISHQNLRSVFRKLNLIDLCGINTRYQARLNIHGIFTPEQFLDAPENLLRKQVFRNINGYYWYLRLRGWEIDAVDFNRKSFGQSYALKKPTHEPKKLSQLLMKLTEKMGRRLRRHLYAAQGIHISCLYQDHTHWHQGRKLHHPIYTTSDLFKQAQLTLNQQPQPKTVTKLAVSCLHLIKNQSSQMELFSLKDKQKEISNACDHINDRFGEYVITPALMMGLHTQIVDRISFGGVKEVQDLYHHSTL